jgi:hypothetical protein
MVTWSGTLTNEHSHDAVVGTEKVRTWPAGAAGCTKNLPTGRSPRLHGDTSMSTSRWN